LWRTNTKCQALAFTQIAFSWNSSKIAQCNWSSNATHVQQWKAQ